MRLLILYNPVAGAGRSVVVGQRLGATLRRLGHDTVLCGSRREPPREWLDAPLRNAEAMVVVGGDGAVRLAGESAMRAGTPIYHYPLGTENLFARGFGMTASAARLQHALLRREVRHIDVGAVNGEAFLLMVSVGFDAEVVRDLAAGRGGRITHLSYARPILRQLTRWQPSRLTIRVDGRAIAEDGPGFVVVANCREYARGLDPACRASPTDGVLDAVFFPARSRRALLGWVVACLRGRQTANPRLVYERGTHVEIRSTPPRRFQLDGDPPACSEVPVRLDVSVRRGVLPVLIP